MHAQHSRKDRQKFKSYRYLFANWKVKYILPFDWCCCSFLLIRVDQLLMEAPCNARSQGPNQLRNIQLKRNIFFKIQGGVPKNAFSECCWSHSALAESEVASTPCVWKLIFGCFLLRLSLIKPSQVMFMVKVSPTALNFGYDFILLVHLFWDTLYK